MKPMVLARMNSAELKERTIRFAVRVLRLANALPNAASGRAVSNQAARSGCSVAANYRAALRGKSRADLINKITIVLEEAESKTPGRRRRASELAVKIGLLAA